MVNLSYEGTQSADGDFGDIVASHAQVRTVG